MRAPWLAMAVAAITLLAAYLVFALLLGSTIRGFEIRIRHGYVLTVVVGAVVGAGLAAARRRGRVSDRWLQRIVLGSASVLVSVLALDTAWDLRDKQRAAAALADEAGDATIPLPRLYAPMFYPTARNFTIYKPGFQSAGAAYGDLYVPEFRRSPTLMRSVLERRWVATSIDIHGFRETTPLADARVLALGDSFVVNPSITQALAWPKLLESLTGEPVYNLGVHDASPAQEVWLLEYVLTTLRPRARRVIWMIFEGNDLENSYEPDPDLAPRAFDQTAFGALAAGLPRLIQDGSVLNGVVSGRVRLRRSAAAAGERVDGVALSSPLWRSARFGPALALGAYVERAAMPESYVAGHPNRPALDAAFGEMQRLAAAHGLDVTVVLAPTFPRLYAAAFDRASAVSATPHFLRFVERLAARSGFPTVNLADLMRPHAERELLYFRDDTHWNERGNRLAAELIAIDQHGGPRNGPPNPQPASRPGSAGALLEMTAHPASARLAAAEPGRSATRPRRCCSENPLPLAVPCGEGQGWGCSRLTPPRLASLAGSTHMGAPTWPPNPQRSERPGGAVALLVSQSKRRVTSEWVSSPGDKIDCAGDRSRVFRLR